MENLQNKYRYERKYILEQINVPKFYFELNRLGYTELHPQRRINNLYLDSISNDYLEENIEGLYKRKKVRIRWYGQFEAPTNKLIEIKQKRGEVNFKQILKLGNFIISKHSNASSIWSSIINTEDNISFVYKNNLHLLAPKLFNSYNRDYFSNPDQSLRITIDKDLEYISPETNLNLFEKNVIIEFKYESDHILKENLFSHLKLNKYSKYVKGLVSVNSFNPNY